MRLLRITPSDKICIFLALLSLILLSSPVAAAVSDNGVGIKNGPFIDHITFDLVNDDSSSQLLAIMDGRLDIMGRRLDTTSYLTAVTAENVEIDSELRNGYGYLIINCDKYPFNETSFRRALAFALDKEKISDDIWDGFSQPLDSVVPSQNPWSIEGFLPYSYYESNMDMANSILDAAGFLDVDDDGFRNAPNGDKFSVEILGDSFYSPVAPQISQLVEETLLALEIDANAKASEFYTILEVVNHHSDYDIVFLGYSFETYDVDWLAYEFWSEYVNEPFHNFANFENSSFDSWRDQLLHSISFEDVYEAAIEMQRILVYECPYIICYQNVDLFAYRTDRFEGFEYLRSPPFWARQKIHLKDEFDGPFGGTLRTATPQVYSFNFMIATDGNTLNVLQELYDPLIRIGPDFEDMNWLALDWIIETRADDVRIPEGHTRLIFEIIQNATWSDGLPITADDVAFTLNYYRDAPGNPYGIDLQEMTAAYSPTPYSVVVDFETESYWHLHTVGYKPILPKHVFENIGLNSWNLWNPEPPEDAMVTSGPFNVSEYIPGEFVELTRNDDYFYSIDFYLEDTDTTDIPYVAISLIIGTISAGTVTLLGGFWLFKRR